MKLLDHWKCPEFRKNCISIKLYFNCAKRKGQTIFSSPNWFQSIQNWILHLLVKSFFFRWTGVVSSQTWKTEIKFFWNDLPDQWLKNCEVLEPTSLDIQLTTKCIENIDYVKFWVWPFGFWPNPFFYPKTAQKVQKKILFSRKMRKDRVLLLHTWIAKAQIFFFLFSFFFCIIYFFWWQTT